MTITSIFLDDNSKYEAPTQAKKAFFRSLIFSLDEKETEETMEVYIASFRKAILQDTGESLAVQKEKIFYCIFQLMAMLFLLDLPEIEKNKSYLYLYNQLENASSIEHAENIHETIIRRLVSEARNLKAEKKDSSLVVKECRSFIEEHITERLSTKVVAEAVNYDQDYISHRFKEELGCTVVEYITRHKINRALTMLAEGKPLAVVSDSLGFSSQSYFTCRFRELTGLTPREYQRWATRQR